MPSQFEDLGKMKPQTAPRAFFYKKRNATGVSNTKAYVEVCTAVWLTSEELETNVRN